MWFKVDDKLHDHRKSRVAKKAAMGVWVLSGSWSMDNLTDGFIPEDVLFRWGNKTDARRIGSTYRALEKWCQRHDRELWQRLVDQEPRDHNARNAYQMQRREGAA